MLCEKLLLPRLSTSGAGNVANANLWRDSRLTGWLSGIRRHLFSSSLGAEHLPGRGGLVPIKTVPKPLIAVPPGRPYFVGRGIRSFGCPAVSLDSPPWKSRLTAEQRKSQRGLLVRLCQHGSRRLLDDLLPDERGDIGSDIDVGDARFGILVDVGSGRCELNSDLKAAENGSDSPGNDTDAILVALDLTLSQERVVLGGQAHPGYRLQAIGGHVVVRSWSVVVVGRSRSRSIAKQHAHGDVAVPSAVTRSFIPSPLKSATATDIRPGSGAEGLLGLKRTVAVAEQHARGVARASPRLPGHFCRRR